MPTLIIESLDNAIHALDARKNRKTAAAEIETAILKLTNMSFDDSNPPKLDKNKTKSLSTKEKTALDKTMTALLSIQKGLSDNQSAETLVADIKDCKDILEFALAAPKNKKLQSLFFVPPKLGEVQFTFRSAEVLTTRIYTDEEMAQREAEATTATNPPIKEKPHRLCNIL